MSPFNSRKHPLVILLFALAINGSVWGVNLALADEQIGAQDTKQDSVAIEDQSWSLYGQLTNITQRHGSFNAPYSGTNSLSPQGPTVETTDATLFIGRRLWQGAEVWLNPEIDQGFGMNGTLGVAGFPSGGAYKIGENKPYLRVPRLFLRQSIDLSGELNSVEAGPNQFAGHQATNNVIVTVGKFAVTDIFDANSYAHDPRADFLNWSIIDAGAYDYAADSWGYTYGGAVEWTQDWWTLRFGFFQLSPVPNAKIARVNFGENSTNIEFEVRQNWLNRAGKIKLLVWDNQARMASYHDALVLAQQTKTISDVASVRRYSSRPGVVLNVEQELSTTVGAFARLSADRGDKEAYEFSDINHSLSAGLSIKGASWNRADDTVGIAGVVNRISGDAQHYLAAGGLGVLVGDGALNYAPEKIAELYYSWHATSYAAVTLDYQHITNPAYNQDRGPVSVYGLRLHANF